MNGSATRPAKPGTPTTRPAISSPPPCCSTQIGSRKKKAKLRKKRKFATETMKNGRGMRCALHVVARRMDNGGRRSQAKRHVGLNCVPRVGMIPGRRMYERYFNLKDQPFRLTPDPAYLFLGTKHREGFAHLLFAMREGSGFVAVTGEVGTGKTTLVRALLGETRNDNIAVSYIFNPVLSPTELLQTINAEFGLPSRAPARRSSPTRSTGFCSRRRPTAAAPSSSSTRRRISIATVLEQLRLLSNLETETEKLMQIILLGQPELRDVLDRPDLRQLSQRVAIRWHLDPLDRQETHKYVRHRVRVAGGDATPLRGEGPRSSSMITRRASRV